MSILDSNQAVDLSILENTAMGDKDFIKEMIVLFVSQGEQQIESLSDYCVDGESSDWVECSHALKGTAACIGAERMRIICRDAQELSEGSASDRNDFLKRIRESYLDAKLFLEHYLVS